MAQISLVPTAVERSDQPWLHDFQISVRGNATCLADRSGDITAYERPGTAGGLYVDDRRVLHHLRLLVDGVPPVPVAADSAGPRTAVLSMARNAGDPGPDPTVHVRRTLALVEGGLVVGVAVTSRSLIDVRCRISIELAGDGVEVHDVKEGRGWRPSRPVVRLPDGAVGWRDDRHETRVAAPGATLDLADRLLATWDVALPPASSVPLELTVSVRRVATTLFDAGSGVGRIAWDEVAVDAQDARLTRTVARSLVDLQALLMTDPQDERDVFAAAGTPWYLTLFGRDSLWAARMGLPFGTDLARGTLRALARRQGTVDNPGRAEQPGKMPHEARRTGFEQAGERSLPPLYYGTVDATPLWVVLLHDAWRWGLADDDVRALATALQAALGWLRRAVDDSPDGFLRYVDPTGSGLVNQGWKDSGDALRQADGSVAVGSMALVESQAYAVEAAYGAADVLEQVLGEPGDRWREWAQALAGRVRGSFWCPGPDGPYLAMALTGDGRRVDGVGSNMGHALGTGMLTREEEALVADRLAAPDLLGPLGIGTLSRRNPGFNPLGYHTGSVWTHDTAIGAWGLARAGHDASAAMVVRALVDVAGASGFRWPELYSAEPVLEAPVPYPASCRPQAWAAASAGLVLRTLLGLSADVPGQTLTVSPLRDAPFGALRVRGLRVAGEPVSVETDGAGEVVDVVAPAGIEVRVSGRGG